MSCFIHSPEHYNTTKKALEPYFEDDRFMKYFLGELTNHKINLNVLIITLINLNVITFFLANKKHFKDKSLNDLIKEELEIFDGVTKTTNKIKTSADLIKSLVSINYQIEIEHLQEIRSLTKDELVSMEYIKMLPFAIAKYSIVNTNDYDNSKCWSI